MNPGTIGGAREEMVFNPDSPLTPYYEDLAKNILALGQGVKSIVVTGPEPQTGRTSVCLGVGVALAGMGRASAVVDCNLRFPHLHRILGEPNFTGLTSGLETGRISERHGFQVVPGLLVIPTGPVTHDSAALLESGKLAEAVRSLENGRDVVLIDAPVAGEVLASRVLSGGFDGVLLVIHGLRTSKKVALETTEDLLEAGVNLLGVVLNGCS